MKPQECQYPINIDQENMQNVSQFKFTEVEHGSKQVQRMTSWAQLLQPPFSHVYRMDVSFLVTRLQSQEFATKELLFPSHVIAARYSRDWYWYSVASSMSIGGSISTLVLRPQLVTFAVFAAIWTPMLALSTRASATWPCASVQHGQHDRDLWAHTSTSWLQWRSVKVYL